MRIPRPLTVESGVAGRQGRAAAGPLQQALNVTLVVAGLYAVWAIRYLTRHSPTDLAFVGRFFLGRGRGSSAVIDSLAPHAQKGVAYDGQFNMFLALDPRHAHDYMDLPAYRTSRFLTAMLARGLAAGKPAAVPTTLLLVNLAAVLAGTFMLALLLRRRGVSPWLALLYGCSPALYVAVSRDLNEPLAYALTIGALLAFDGDRLLSAAALFGLAGIARETTLLFPLAVGVALLLGLGVVRTRVARVALFAALSFLPYIVLRLVLLGLLGQDPAPGPPREWIPFHGLWAVRPLDQTDLEVVYTVVLPSFVAVVAIAVLVRRLTPLTLALGVNVVGLVVLLPKSAYFAYIHAGRITLGVVVATLCCLPLLPARARPALIGVLGVLWLTPWDFWFPYAFLG